MELANTMVTIKTKYSVHTLIFCLEEGVLNPQKKTKYRENSERKELSNHGTSHRGIMVTKNLCAIVKLDAKQMFWIVPTTINIIRICWNKLLSIKSQLAGCYYIEWLSITQREPMLNNSNKQEDSCKNFPGCSHVQNVETTCMRWW
jgi:hypothetical protein